MIMLLITQHRKKKYHNTGLFTLPKDWDNNAGAPKPTHPNYIRLSMKLAEKKKETWDKIIMQPGQVSAEQIKYSIDNIASEDFYKIAENHIRNYVKQGTIKSYETAINNLKSFRPTLYFTDITPDLLRKYEAHFLRNGKRINTIHTNMKRIRAIMYRHKGKFFPGNPFAEYALKTEKTMKEYLTVEELQLFRNESRVKINTWSWHARNLFLFQFNQRGMRISDAVSIKWSAIRNGTMQYRMDKTSSPLDMALTPESMCILSLYKKHNGYVFPFMDKCKDMKSITALVNKHLQRIAKWAGINKHMTSHVARHTVGNLARIYLQDISLGRQFFDHSDIRTTQVYYGSFPNEKVDEANLKLMEIAGFKK